MPRERESIVPSPDEVVRILTRPLNKLKLLGLLTTISGRLYDSRQYLDIIRNNPFLVRPEDTALQDQLRNLSEDLKAVQLEVHKAQEVLGD